MCTQSSGQTHFYPRPPCGGRRCRNKWQLTHKGFLSTSPLRGSTLHRGQVHPVCQNFYPRPPCGGRRNASPFLALHTANFYPRPPCGGRLSAQPPNRRVNKFLSTSPLRGTTYPSASCSSAPVISIHVPLAGDDPPCPTTTATPTTFLSTSPLRGTTPSRRRTGASC